VSPSMHPFNELYGAITSWEANYRSVTQEIPNISRNLKVLRRVYKSLPLIPAQQVDLLQSNSWTYFSSTHTGTTQIQ
jgi:hypothetical protein